MGDCPSADELAAFLSGNLAPPSRQRLHDHLDLCPECTELIADLGRAMTSPLAPPDEPAPHLDLPVAGERLGRFEIEEILGAGGMGVVLAARDPKLDRRVALKLLRPTGGAEERASLEREARALARLTHPNVVVVHEVGEADDRLFLVMELVEGQTLQAWMRAPHPWHEILRVFVAAGQGLAAAHAAGLVHRDFKPANVFIGADGRPRVGDFGLVRATAERGGVAGTPAYMAPEQLAGAAADALSDQYAFCVALWEALTGERPRRGALPLAARGVPPWLAGRVQRGLQITPGERYPSMAALLQALADDPAVRRRRVGLGVAAVVALGVAVLAGARLVGRPPASCAGVDAPIQALLPVARRARIEAAFRASGRPFATVAARSVLDGLDAYTGAWARGRRGACEAGRQRRELSARAHDARAACYDARLHDLAALLLLLDRADAGVVTAVAANGLGLPPVEACDAPALLDAPPEPDDPIVRGAIAAARQRVSAAQALFVVGRYPDALVEARAAAAAAEGAAHAPVTAAALLLLARLQAYNGDARGAEATLDRAIEAAERARDDVTRALAWAEMVRVVAVMQHRTADGHTWMKYARAALSHDPDPSAAALLDHMEGLLYNEERAPAEALALLRRSLEGHRRAHGVDDPHLVSVRTDIALALEASGRVAEAQIEEEAALADARRLFGDAHPRTTRLVNNLGVVAYHLGHKDEALRRFQDALAQRERLLGPTHPDLAIGLLNVASVLEELGRRDEALASYRRAAAIWEQQGGTSPNLAGAWTGAGSVLVEQGRAAEALPLLERALARREADPLTAPEDRARTRFVTARALWDSRGGRPRALALAAAARGDLDAAAPPARRGELRDEVEAWLAARRKR